jgi:DNA-binding HxlR family transcriptional regulator
MPKINQNKETEQFILKKAFEISYALCRIAKNLKNTYFSNIFEERGLQILDSATKKDFESLKNSFLGIEYFIRLGEELGLFRNHIAELLIGEINSLNKYIIEAEEEILMPELNIEDIFTSKNGKTLKKTKQNESFLNSAKDSATDSAKEKDSATGSAMNSAKADNSATRDSAMNNNSAKGIDSAMNNSAMNSATEIDSAKQKGSAMEDSAIKSNIDSAMEDSAMTYNSAMENDSAMDSAMKIENNSATEDNPLNIQNNKNQEPTFIHISKIISEEPKDEPKDDSIGIIKVRKSVFLDKIRYFEEFRLKDLEKMFPELSERTLRYYLSDLISLGFIEKIGVSGPNVLYRFNKNKEADILAFIQKERENLETEPLEIDV